MALTPAFSAVGTQDPTAILLTDLSTGSDGAVVSRKVSLYDVGNNLFGASPYSWPNFPGTTTLTINPLLADKAAIILVQWLNNVGAVLYSLSGIAAFNGYANLQLQSLTQTQQGKPNIIQDQGYFLNKFTLRELVNSCQQAISQGSDVYSAQECIDLYTPMLQNPTDFF